MIKAAGLLTVRSLSLDAVQLGWLGQGGTMESAYGESKFTHKLRACTSVAMAWRLGSGRITMQMYGVRGYCTRLLPSVLGWLAGQPVYSQAQRLAKQLSPLSCKHPERPLQQATQFSSASEMWQVDGGHSYVSIRTQASLLVTLCT
jgi:hypothetical protein